MAKKKDKATEKKKHTFTLDGTKIQMPRATTVVIGYYGEPKFHNAQTIRLFPDTYSAYAFKNTMNRGNSWGYTYVVLDSASVDWGSIPQKLIQKEKKKNPISGPPQYDTKKRTRKLIISGSIDVVDIE